MTVVSHNFWSSEWRRAAPVCRFERWVSAAIAHLAVESHGGAVNGKLNVELGCVGRASIR